mgnify:CR=1 FL=1
MKVCFEIVCDFHIDASYLAKVKRLDKTVLGFDCKICYMSCTSITHQTTSV